MHRSTLFVVVMVPVSMSSWTMFGSFVVIIVIVVIGFTFVVVVVVVGMTISFLIHELLILKGNKVIPILFFFFTGQ